MEFMAKMGSFRVMSVLLSKNKLRSVKLESYIGAGTVAFDHVRSPSLPFLVVSAQIDVLRMYTRLPKRPPPGIDLLKVWDILYESGLGLCDTKSNRNLVDRDRPSHRKYTPVVHQANAQSRIPNVDQSPALTHPQ